MSNDVVLISLSEKMIFAVLFVIAAFIFLRIFYVRFKLIQLGNKNVSFKFNFKKQFETFLLYVPGQLCNIRNIRQKDLAGLAHLAIFWGVVFFAIDYFLFLLIGDGFGVSEIIRGNSISTAFLWITEITGIFMLAGLASGVVRRGVIKPGRLGPDFEFQTFFLITFFAHVLLLCYFILEGCRLNLEPDYVAGPVSYIVAGFFSHFGVGADIQHNLFQFTWWIHNIILLGFIVYIPFSKHQHAVFFPINALTNLSPETTDVFKPIDFELNASEQKQFGVSRIEDFSRSQLIELYTCAQCGRCQDVCPAYASGKPLSPKKLIQDLRKGLDSKGNFKLLPLAKCYNENANDGLLVNENISEDEIWACTTCMACTNVCPVMLGHLDKVMDIRRGLTLMESRFPAEAKSVFKDLETFGDPLGMGSYLRADWSRHLNIKEISEKNKPAMLLWVGCLSSFYNRNIDVAIALTKILNAAEIDFAILGKEEICCGDPARRMGNEYIFQSIATKNIKLFNEYGVKKIITICPHCYNVFKNEYDQFGADIDVIHYPDLISDLLEKGKINPRKKLDETITYHDPCYLGRYNNIYDLPRKILNGLSEANMVEAENNKDNSFCCGGGGGLIFLQEHIGERINELRAEQCINTGAQTIATACPHCLTMMEDGVKAKEREGEVKVYDIAEIVQRVL